MQIFFTLKANKSQAKEIKCLLIQKKIQVELTTQISREIIYRSMYNLLDFVLNPGSLHYCVSLMIKLWIHERTSMRAAC